MGCPAGSADFAPCAAAVGKAFKAFQKEAVKRKSEVKCGKEKALFTTTHSYLKGVLNGKTTLPAKAWKAERDNLTDERKMLNQEVSFPQRRGEAIRANQKERLQYLAAGTARTATQTGQDMDR